MIEGKDFTVIFGNFRGAGDLFSLAYVLLAAVSFVVARFSLAPSLFRPQGVPEPDGPRFPDAERLTGGRSGIVGGREMGAGNST